jgi:hypothetical protein
MINLVNNKRFKIFKENLIFLFRFKDLKYMLKVSGNDKKLNLGYNITIIFHF